MWFLVGVDAVAGGVFLLSWLLSPLVLSPVDGCCYQWAILAVSEAAVTVGSVTGGWPGVIFSLAASTLNVLFVDCSHRDTHWPSCSCHSMRIPILFMSCKVSNKKSNGKSSLIIGVLDEVSDLKCIFL